MKTRFVFMRLRSSFLYGEEDWIDWEATEAEQVTWWLTITGNLRGLVNTVHLSWRWTVFCLIRSNRSDIEAE